MIYYDSIDVSEGIDVNKTSEMKEWNICHYWYFLDKGFKFWTYVCSGCHVLLIMSTNLNNIVILSIRGADYCCIITGISKNKAADLLHHAGSSEKKWGIVNYEVFNCIENG